jgi:crossover junction endonuclease MUS81
MKACPLHFNHPSEAQQLHGLGPKLCDRLADKLRAHCAANGLPMPQLPHQSSKRGSDDDDERITQPVKKARKTKAYVPTLRSGAYALVLALATLGEHATQGLTKVETIQLAQPHCDASFTAPSDPTKFYTAWNSMKTLIGKDLVDERGRPLRRYMLTDEGWEVAKRIQGARDGSITQTLPRTSAPTEIEVPNERINGRAALTSRSANDDHFQLVAIDESEDEDEIDKRPPPLSVNHDPSALPTFSPIIVPAGTFTIHLVLDTREVRTTTDRDYISSELRKGGVTTINRALPLGDAVWIARLKPEQRLRVAAANIGDDEEGSDEIVLDHIAERKRLDDLIFSIKDGRFHEQKFRLRRSGVKNVTYIIEDYSMSEENGQKHGEAVDSAIASTQVVNDYFVKRTAKLDDTIRYLLQMTKTLEAFYMTKDLHIIPSSVLHPKTYLQLMTRIREIEPSKGHYITFSVFSSLCSKSDMITLRDVYLKMLMCIRGVTGERAIEIQKRWPTPRDLIEAFAASDDPKGKETMVSQRTATLIPRKKIVKGLSAKIAEVWG